MNKEIKISVVIPVYNEQDSVKNLYEENVRVLNALNQSYEIIFINDGSTDETLNVLKTLTPIKIIDFRKNFGQTAALDAGFKYAKGEFIIAMDGDGQNDPNDIPRLIEKLKKENLDVVTGWRKNRKDSLLKKFSSRCAAILRKFLLNDNIHDSGCTLKVFKRECIENLDLFGEMHRFIPALLKIRGFSVEEIEVNHRPRAAGKTKYNWKRGIKGILDMISVWFWKRYANRPLHLFGGFGMFLFFLSLISAAFLVYQKIFNGQDLSDNALTETTLFALIISIQFVVFGLLADIISKNHFSITKSKPYHIKDILEN